MIYINLDQIGLDGPNGLKWTEVDWMYQGGPNRPKWTEWTKLD